MAWVLHTRNPTAGFWGVLIRAGHRPLKHWTHTSHIVAERFSLTHHQVRDFLDSHHGAKLAHGLMDGHNIEWVAMWFDGAIHAALMALFISSSDR